LTSNFFFLIFLSYMLVFYLSDDVFKGKKLFFP
jgi:hypothetical protein